MSTSRSNTAWKATALLQDLLTTPYGNTYLDIDVLLGGCLEELNSQLVGQLATALEANHSLVLHVALVAHQDHLGIVPGVSLDLCDPGTAI